MLILLLRPKYDNWTRFCYTASGKIEELLTENNLNFKSLKLCEVSKEEVLSCIKEYRNEIIIIIGYGHGNDNSYFGFSNLPIFTSTETESFYLNFFYLHSCHTGKLLGKEISENNGIGFIGYDDEVKANYQDLLPFENTANHGIVKIILNNYSVREAFEDMKSKYDDEMKNTLNTRNFYTYQLLKQNKDSLVFFGDGAHKFF